jgi:hypothetical protein
VLENPLSPQPLNLDDPIAVLLGASRELRSAGVEHAAYGGLALAVYGEPRETKDADLAVAGLAVDVGERALAALGATVVKAFERVRFGGHLITRFTLLEGGGAPGLNTVDLVEPRSQRYAAAALARAVEGSLRGERLRVLAPEDFVLFKALSTRERDLEDAASVLRALGPRLDRALIHTQAAQLASEIVDHDIASRLRRAEELAGR